MVNWRRPRQTVFHQIGRRRTSSTFVLPRRYAVFRCPGLVSEWFFLLDQPVSAKHRESTPETRAGAVVFSAVVPLESVPDRQPCAASEARGEARGFSS